jgi:hypothetical protein
MTPGMRAGDRVDKAHARDYCQTSNAVSPDPRHTPAGVEHEARRTWP